MEHGRPLSSLRKSLPFVKKKYSPPTTRIQKKNETEKEPR